jgi:hypothetical protein
VCTLEGNCERFRYHLCRVAFLDGLFSDLRDAWETAKERCSMILVGFAILFIEYIGVPLLGLYAIVRIIKFAWR